MCAPRFELWLCDRVYDFPRTCWLWLPSDCVTACSLTAFLNWDLVQTLGWERVEWWHPHKEETSNGLPSILIRFCSLPHKVRPYCTSSQSLTVWMHAIYTWVSFFSVSFVASLKGGTGRGHLIHIIVAPPEVNPSIYCMLQGKPWAWVASLQRHKEYFVTALG